VSGQLNVGGDATVSGDLFVLGDLNFTTGGDIVADNITATGDLISSGFLTLVRPNSAGNFFHAYKNDGTEQTVSLYVTSTISPLWRLGLKTNPNDQTASPEYGYVFGRDGSVGMVGNADNYFSLSDSAGYQIRHDTSDIFIGSRTGGVSIEGIASTTPVLSINGSVGATDDLQRWENNSITLSVVDSGGKLGVLNSSPVYDLDVIGSGRMGSIYLTSGIFFQDGTFQSSASVGGGGSGDATAISGWADSTMTARDNAVSGWAGSTMVALDVVQSGYFQTYIDSQDHSAIAVSGWADSTMTNRDNAVSGWASSTFGGPVTGTPSGVGFFSDDQSLTDSSDLQFDSGNKRFILASDATLSWGTSPQLVADSAGAGLILRSNTPDSSQYLDIFGDYASSTSFEKFRIRPSGSDVYLSLEVGSVSGEPGSIIFQNDSVSMPLSVIRGGIGQSANLTEWQDSAGDAPLVIGADQGIDFYDTAASQKEVDINWSSNVFKIESFLSTQISLQSRDWVNIQHGPSRGIRFYDQAATLMLTVRKDPITGYGSLRADDHFPVQFTGRVDLGLGEPALLFINDVDIVAGDTLATFQANVTDQLRIGDTLRALEVDCISTNQVGQTIKGQPLQIANLTEWIDSTSGVLSFIDASGDFHGSNIHISGQLVASGDPGTNGQFLKSTGTGVQWTTIAAGGNRTYISVSGDYSMSDSEDVVFADSTPGAINVYIPTAVGVGGKEIMIKRAAGTNTVIINASGAQSIDGLSTQSLLNPFQSLSLISDNSNWFIS
jgi:hypothetical protein